MRYRQALAHRFIKNNPSYKLCVNGDCEMFIFRNDKKVTEVECRCGTKFCFLCGEEAHRPSSCQDIQRWKVAIYKDDSTNWLRRYTSMCPHCLIITERIEGCNQMTCPLPIGCGGIFCHICSNPWKPAHK